MTARIWGSNDDGSIDYVSLTQSTLEESLNFLRTYFFPQEALCTVMELGQHPEAVEDLINLAKYGAREGISIVAIEKDTKEVAGVVLNKLHLKEGNEFDFIKYYGNKWKHEISKGFLDFLVEIESVVNLFDVCHTNCLLELLYLGVHPDFRKRGIAKTLVKLSVDVAKALNNRESVKVALNDDVLPIEPIPGACITVPTSPYTQRITEQLGFIKVVERDYEDLIYKGKTYSSTLSSRPGFNSVTVEYKLV